MLCLTEVQIKNDSRNILVAGIDSRTGAGLTGLTPHRISIETTQTVLTSVPSSVMKTLLQKTQEKVVRTLDPLSRTHVVTY